MLHEKSGKNMIVRRFFEEYLVRDDERIPEGRLRRALTGSDVGQIVFDNNDGQFVSILFDNEFANE